MKYNSYRAERGFSLVEVLVAITILLLVIVGPMRILSQSNSSTGYSIDQTTAFLLAQEGLELTGARLNLRMLGDFKDIITETNLNNPPWTQFQTDMIHCFNGKNCGLYASSTYPYVALADCNGTTKAPNCVLGVNSNQNARDRYTHATPTTANPKSPFTRIIQFKIATSTNDSTKVAGMWATSTVTWRSAGFIADQKAELVTYFTNIYDTR